MAKINYSIRFTAEDLQELQRIAASQHRTPANLLDLIIQNYLRDYRRAKHKGNLK